MCQLRTIVKIALHVHNNTYYVGELNLRNLLILTTKVAENWVELGLALDIPISKILKLSDKYNNNLLKGLTSVYCYWLDDKNNLSPTWDKLIAALHKIKEYEIAANVKQYKEVS